MKKPYRFGKVFFIELTIVVNCHLRWRCGNITITQCFALQFTRACEQCIEQRENSRKLCLQFTFYRGFLRSRPCPRG